MSNKTTCHLWIPSPLLEDVSAKAPLRNVEEAVSGQLRKALLDDPGYLGQLAKQYVLVRIRHWINKEGDVTGVLGKVMPGMHSVYPRGLIFTTDNWVDVHYHLRTRTIEERVGIDRIEVHVPDRGKDLAQFVLEALKKYGLEGTVTTERERHLLFYRPIYASPASPISTIGVL